MASSNKSPAFQFYAAEFLADENVALMSNQEIGCYIKLICYCWREGSIPAEIVKIARLCGEDGSAMAQLWLSIRLCFDAANGSPDRLVHPRLQKELEKQNLFKEERAASGKKGAEARWDKAKGKGRSAIAKPIAKPIAVDGSSSSSSSSSSSTTKSSSARGSRLPADWVPSDSDLAFIRKERPDLDIRGTQGQFFDYWTSLAGQKALKTDWAAAWRNWVRRQDVGRSGGGGGGSGTNFHDDRKAFMDELTGRTRNASIDNANIIDI